MRTNVSKAPAFLKSNEFKKKSYAITQNQKEEIAVGTAKARLAFVPLHNLANPSCKSSPFVRHETYKNRMLIYNFVQKYSRRDLHLKHIRKKKTKDISCN